MNYQPCGMNYWVDEQIRKKFAHEPTPEQGAAIVQLAGFITRRSRDDQAFILRGFAGTGKTSLVAALVKAMEELKQKTILLAPTGRAAKVFSGYAGTSAFTIHKKIYRQKSFSNETTHFLLDDNLHTHTLFIVDEASMIANDGLSGAMFGAGRLLDDLIQYVYSGADCRLLLLGDSAQLPPVGEELSPALYKEALAAYGLEVTEMTLTQVVRQSLDSGILWNATMLRQLIAEEAFSRLPSIRVKGFTDIVSLPGNELIEALNECYDRDGTTGTIVVCRSNKQATLYNKGIRSSILYREEELGTGDWLMIAKNNYYWTEQCKEIDFIANGETVQVRRVRKVYEMYGFRFADVTLTFPDQEGLELDAKILLDALYSNAPALPKEDNDRLFYAVLEDYAHLSVKQERMKKMKTDPHYNALQVKFAYAVTCHKAQGGQWANVFLDQGYMTDEHVNSDYFRWLYTAFTRATKRLYLVNFPTQ